MTIFICKYCESVVEKDVNLHNCESKKRHELVKTNLGQVAFKYYVEWRRFNKHNTPLIETFVGSRYFTSFIRFVEYVRIMNIPEPIEYIKFMTKKGLLPAHWSSDNTYVEYIEYFDLSRTPRQQVDTSIQTLSTMARMMDCEISEVLDHIRPGQMIKLLQARKLSPWVLLFSGKFRNFLNTKVSQEQAIFLENFINPIIWERKFKNDPSLVIEVKNNVQNLKL